MRECCQIYTAYDSWKEARRAATLFETCLAGKPKMEPFLCFDIPGQWHVTKAVPDGKD
jgi:hypothetical protein